MTLVRSFRLIPVSTIFAFVVVALLAVSPASAACGDGVVDAGEDCDDGSSQNGGTNSCCTAGCTFSGKSPDVIVGDLVGTSNYGAVGGIRGYAIGTTSCNLGSCWLLWISNSANKPIIGQNMYRLKDGRFEQLGQSWLKHAFTALQGNVCSNSCVASGTGSRLGVNCSDPYSSGLNGEQSRLGPKSDVNPDSGVYMYPDSRIGTTGNAIFKRLQVLETDINPALNAGALYFVEGQYVTLDDAKAKNQNNNASYRSLTVGASPNFNLTLTGTTQRQQMGIQAWKDIDPSVTETFVAASEGLFVVAAKATDLGGGIYHYEYAVQNLTNNRGAQSFTVPIPAGTVITNVGFHDVNYHSNEPFDGTDWTSSVASTSVSWSTTPHSVNPNANALRWGTLYNFRFDADLAPGFAAASLGLFKPGSPTSATFSTVVPNPCFGATNGAPCSDGNGCTLTDTCQSGTCQGATPVVCTAMDSCHLAGACSPDTGFCTNPLAPNGTACSDGNGCTQTDACQSGTCVGSNPVVCVPQDACHTAGVCGPGTGLCSNPARPNGTACSDGNACTQSDTCQAGTCTGSSPVVCAALNNCHLAGTCTPGTGVCSNPMKPDGSACTDFDACTQTDACVSGTCAGSEPVVCSASDDCHQVGTCDSQTGLCSNPVASEGTICSDANSCTTGDNCQAGVCVGVGSSVPEEVDGGVLLSHADGLTTITWNAATGSDWSDVLRGHIAGLPVGPGGGDEVCMQSGTQATVATDGDTPNPEEGFWYLVTGGNACGTGSYGTELHNGDEVPRSSATCP